MRSEASQGRSAAERGGVAGFFDRKIPVTGIRSSARSCVVALRLSNQGFSFASRLVVTRLGLGTASLRQKLLPHRSGVRIPHAKCSALCYPSSIFTAFKSAEGEGFEPSVPCDTHAFQACALDHYANPPSMRLEYKPTTILLKGGGRFRGRFVFLTSCSSCHRWSAADSSSTP